MASDSQATSEGSWWVHSQAGSNPKQTVRILSARESFALTGAGDGDYVDSVTSATHDTPFGTISDTLELITGLGMELLDHRLALFFEDRRKQRHKTQSSDILSSGASDVLDILEGTGVRGIVGAEFLVADVKEETAVYHITAGGTLIRKVAAPWLVIGSGKTASDAWRDAVRTPASADPSPVNVFVDLLCIFSLGFNVTGVGGVPAFTLVRPEGARTCDTWSSIALTNLGGLYLAGHIARSKMERLASYILQHGGISRESLCELGLDLDQGITEILGLGPFSYSFWLQHAGAKNACISLVGPFPIHGHGLGHGSGQVPNHAFSSDERAAVFLNRKELHGLVSIATPKKADMHRIVIDPDEYADGDADIAQLWLSHTANDRTTGDGPLGKEPWSLDPFGKLAIVPLFRFILKDTRKGFPREARILSAMWVNAIRDYWCECLPENDPRPQIQRIRSAVDLLFGYFPKLS